MTANRSASRWALAAITTLLLLALFGWSIAAARELGLRLPPIISEDTNDFLPAALRLAFGAVYAVSVFAVLFKAKSVKTTGSLVALNLTGNGLAFGFFYALSNAGMEDYGNLGVTNLTMIIAIVQLGLLIVWSSFTMRRKSL